MDNKSPKPFDSRSRRMQVEEKLADLMQTMQPGEQLPPEPALAKQFGVSRATLREVLRTFTERGLLLRRQGLGTFIASRIPVLETGLEILESLDRMAARLGLETEVTHLNVLEGDATPAELAGLALAPEEPTRVLVVDRVIAVGGRPVADLRDVVPVTYLRQSDLGPDFRGSVLDVLLLRDDLMLSTSRTDIAIEKASAQSAARLDVPRDAALLKLTAQLYAYDEKIVDYSTSFFVPGYFKFHVIRKVVGK